MQYFVFPVSRSALERTNRKRKRQHQDGSSDSSPSEEADELPGSTVGSRPQADGVSSAITSLTASTVAQYRAAGHSFEDAVPAHPFPHAPVDYLSRKGKTKSKVKKEVASYVANPSVGAQPSEVPSSGPRTRREQHLGVVTTIMHRCLLNGDYERAGRAWGMLLRARGFDVRKQGKWGIGAEILFRVDGQRAASRPNEQQLDGRYRESEDVPHHVNSDWFSEEGFLKARSYYERLILQYPSRRQHLHSTIDSRTFYPAMFSLWIYEVQEKSRRRREERSSRPETNQRHQRSNTSSSVDSHGEVSRSGASEPAPEDKHASGDEMSLDSTNALDNGEQRSEELRGAQEIAARLDELFMSPPYDRQAELLRMRAMVALWIGDLLLVSNPQSSHQFNSHENSSDHYETLVSGQGDGDPRRARGEELQKAEHFFQRAKECSVTLAQGDQSNEMIETDD